MKICEECGVEFDNQFRNIRSKYCGDNCRAKISSRASKKTRLLRKERALHDLDFCSIETFKKYKQRSPIRKLEFTLTVEDFRNNIEKPCYYCGDDYQGIGFDRVINEIGYHKQNIVPCCPVCNRMKHSAGLNDFLERCKRIAITHK